MVEHLIIRAEGRDIDSLQFRLGFVASLDELKKMRCVKPCRFLTPIDGPIECFKRIEIAEQLEVTHSKPAVILCRGNGQTVVGCDAFLEFFEEDPTLNVALQRYAREAFGNKLCNLCHMTADVPPVHW